MKSKLSFFAQHLPKTSEVCYHFDSSYNHIVNVILFLYVHICHVLKIVQEMATKMKIEKAHIELMLTFSSNKVYYSLKHVTKII